MFVLPKEGQHMNITEYSRHWYTVREDHWRPNTQHGYYNLIEHHILP